MSLWHWDELNQACNLTEPVAGAAVSGICIDSRSIEVGDLFIALAGDPGPRFFSSSTSARDGHEFLQGAVDNGAAVLLVSQDVEFSVPSLVVEDTLDGLWQLGQYARQRIDGKVAAITGSSGKTTARQWLEQLLVEQSTTHASIGSLNNHWGVPLSLARMPRQSKFGIFEIGTNRPGEIQPLAELVSPDVALVLNVLPAHIGHFGGLEKIRQEKLSISQGLKSDGLLVVPFELELSGVAARNVLTFGLTPEADVSGIAHYDQAGTRVDADICGIHVSYQLNVGGEHRVLTSLAVLAVVHGLGADVELAASHFSRLTTPEGRGNELHVAGIKIINDSYNANPVSMKYALQALKDEASTGKRIALLGEMLELGDSSQSCHQEMAKCTEGLDVVITVGDGFISCPGQQGHSNSAAEIDIPALAESLNAGDVVLVKGSNKVFWAAKFVEKLAAELKGN